MARAIVDLEPGSSSICSSEELRLLKEEPQDTAHQVLGPQVGAEGQSRLDAGCHLSKERPRYSSKIALLGA
jgi:hypothetical protein